jgi:beta-1,4-mannosyltransferase
MGSSLLHQFPAEPQERTVVLMSPGLPKANENPFVSLLVGNLPSDIEVIPFTWRRAFFSSYDVLHLHWPDHLVGDPSWLKSIVKSGLFRVLLIRNQFSRAHVRTVHNLKPHVDGRWFTRCAEAAWIRSCSTSVYLSIAGEGTASSSSTKRAIIVHGDYEAFVRPLMDDKAQPVPGRILMFGNLRRYKGVEQLVTSFNDLPQPSAWRLRIIGTPESGDYGSELSALCGGNPLIELVLGRQEDPAMVREIQRASIVAIPYNQVYNSGVALMALTLQRPIVVTNSETMTELQREVGEVWVRPIGEWTGSNLHRAASVAVGASAPDLSSRDWADLAADYAAVYRGSVK